MKNLLFIVLLIFAAGAKAQTFNGVENLIASERFDEAIDSLQVIKSKNPQNQFVYFGLGETILQSFKADSISNSKNVIIKKARNYFQEGVKADSLNPLNYVGLGILELYQNDSYYNADQYFNKALKLIPEKKKHIRDIHIKTLIKLATAELYRSEPRIDKSKEYIARLKEIAPKNPEVYLAEGDILLYKNVNASDAITSYEKALSLNNNPLSNVKIGKVYLSGRIFKDAEKHFENAIKEDSLFAPAYKGMGDLDYQTGRIALAKQNYAKFLQLTGNNIPAKISYTKALFLAKDYKEALKSAEEIIKKDSSKTFLYRIAGYSAYEKEEPDLATARFNMDKLFKIASNEQLIPLDYQNYGQIILEQNKDSLEIAKGIDMLEKAYHADSTNVKLISEILKNAYRYKVYPVAAKYLTLLIHKGMDTPNNYKLLGKIYYQLNKYDMADSAFRKVIAKEPDNVEAYLWLGYISSAQDPDMKTGLAKPDFEKLLTVIGNDTVKYQKETCDAYNYLASYYLLSEKHTDLNMAEHYFQKLLAASSAKNVQIKSMHSLAYIKAKQKNYGVAKAYYQKILELNPNDNDAKRGLRFTEKNLNTRK